MSDRHGGADRQETVERQETHGRVWWRDAVIYQVYPRSFSDSDGDGIGDLPGVTARLDHLVELGVDAVWLSPFYPSPQVDAGYDVSNYRGVDPRFGTLTDFDALVEAASARGLRLIVDLVPNHTSSAHPWFQAALAAGPGSPERDRYHFRKGRGADGELPPNSWTSVFGGPAWTRVTEANGAPGEWYLHLFDPSQPDLNWDHAGVRAEFEDVLRFWLDRGVSGFRVDVANGLVKEAGLPEWDQPYNLLAQVEADYRPPPMWDQEGVHEIYRSWRQLLDGYTGERSRSRILADAGTAQDDSADRILVGEAWVAPAERLFRYVRADEMHQVFNFDYLFTPWTDEGQRRAINGSLTAATSVGAVATWVLSNHDVLRHATRLAFQPGAPLPNGIGIGDPQPDATLGLRRARAATLLMLALPGSAYLYQGEELGLPEHTTLPDEARQDPTWQRSGHTIRGRDGCRVPIPWRADAPSYGFGPSANSWLPQPPSWASYALDRQRGVPGSTYEMYRQALRLRREYELGSQRLTWLPRTDVLAFGTGERRSTEPAQVPARDELVVLTNFGPAPAPLPPGEVLIASADLAADGSLPPDTTAWIRP